VEGRLLAKENAKPPIPAPDSEPNEWANTWLVGVRQEAYYFETPDLRWEPCALGARALVLCGGCRVTGIPTATGRLVIGLPASLPTPRGMLTLFAARRSVGQVVNLVRW
jgi:hypothetical protein